MGVSKDFLQEISEELNTTFTEQEVLGNNGYLSSNGIIGVFNSGVQFSFSSSLEDMPIDMLEQRRGRIGIKQSWFDETLVKKISRFLQTKHVFVDKKGVSPMLIKKHVTILIAPIIPSN